MKVLSRETVEQFGKLVPSAVVNVAESVARLKVDGVTAIIRIKRAASIANQVQVWRGEPIVVHVPTKRGSDRWFVLPITWQMSFARKHATTANQHASHAFDCMMIKLSELPKAHLVAEADLRTACEAAVREASSKEIRFVVKAISRARGAVANVLIDTLEEEFFKS